MICVGISPHFLLRILLEENFWYTNGIKELSSSMEMSNLIGWNVAKVVINGVDVRVEGRLRQTKKQGERMPKLTLGDYLKRRYEGVD